MDNRKLAFHRFDDGWKNARYYHCQEYIEETKQMDEKVKDRYVQHGSPVKSDPATGIAQVPRTRILLPLRAPR